MLREYSRELDRTWVVADVGLCVASFIVLVHHPRFAIDAGDSSMGTLATASLGLTTGLVWQMLLNHFGAYESHRRGGVLHMVRRLFYANATATLILAATCFILGVPAAPLFPLALGALLLAIQIATRVPASMVLRMLRRRGHNFRNIVIVGTGKRALLTTETISNHPEWGLRVIAYLDDGDPSFDPVVPVDKIHKFMDLPTLLRDETVDEVMVSCPRSMLDSLTPVVRECSMVGIPVTLMTDFFSDQLPAPKIGVFDSIKTLSFAPVHHNELELVVKRGVDILGGLVGLAISAPMIGIAAIFIRLNSDGPVFFRQVRVGHNGRRFNMLKLRTMSMNAESLKHGLLHLNEMDGPVFKVKDDPRITSVGTILRRFSIDELPQFWNVLGGDMSLVGPRPPTPDEVILYQGDTRRRLSMRPGLTCYWQISGRNNLSFADWIKLDLLYIDTWSLMRDFNILIRTLPSVISGKGAS